MVREQRTVIWRFPNAVLHRASLTVMSRLESLVIEVGFAKKSWPERSYDRVFTAGAATFLLSSRKSHGRCFRRWSQKHTAPQFQ